MSGEPYSRLPTMEDDRSGSSSPEDDLLGLDDVAFILRVDRSRVHEKSAALGFPDPEIRGLGETWYGAYWRRSDVDAWLLDQDLAPEEAEDDPWDIHVDASKAARRYIREHGGRVFVWLHPVNEAWVTQKVSTKAPPGGPLFDEFDADGFTLFLDRALEPPEGVVRLRLRRWWPSQPLSLRTGLETWWQRVAPRSFEDQG